MKDFSKIDIVKTPKGTQIKYIKRCEMCKFAKMDLIKETLFCQKQMHIAITNSSYCNIYKIDERIKNDLIDILNGSYYF